MFNILQLRNGDIHIIDYQTSRGSYKTICGKIFTTACYNLNLLAIDNTTNSICNMCKNYCNKIFNSSMNSDPRILKCNSYNFKTILDFHKYNYMGPKEKFERLLTRRHNFRFNRLKSKINRNSYNNKYYAK